MFTSFVATSGLRPVMGQQVGDGVNSVADVLVAAETAGQRLSVLQVGDAVFDPDTARGMRLALPLIHVRVPGGGTLLKLVIGGVITVPRSRHPGPGSRHRRLHPSQPRHQPLRTAHLADGLSGAAGAAAPSWQSRDADL
ncbi:hypothetical protein GCM10010255_82940 [Streptomyces coeruleofuscus]|uniref:Uncharacterized protein n=1 Tax=Streptomyces coeruleofuscus TaxID=66879 RepID=A0ABN3JGH5_9ACTN